MGLYDIAGMYAKALFGISRSEEEMSQRDEILHALVLQCIKVPEMYRFILNPYNLMEKKEKVLQKVTNDQKCMDFLLLLLKKRKFKYLPEIARKFHQLVLTSCNVIETDLITATQLDPSLKEEIKFFLEKALHKKVVFREQIDPTMLGGSIIIYDNRILDLSLKGRLEKMQKSLLRKRVNES